MSTYIYELSFWAATPHVARWDETPAHINAGDATPSGGSGATPAGRHQWDATPSAQTPRRNRWDETPRDGGASVRDVSMTPGWGMDTPARPDHDIKLEDALGRT